MRRWGCSGPARTNHRPDAFGQVSLGHELEFHLAAAVQGVEDMAVDLARKAADHLAYSTGLQQCGYAVFAISGVVADDRQVLRALPDQRVDQVERHPGEPEAADQDDGTVLDPGDRFVRRL